MNNYPTWQRAHCVECWQAPEACNRCGCHADPEAQE